MNQVAIRKDSPPSLRQFINFIQSPKFLGTVLAIVNYIVIFTILMASMLPKQYSLKVGDILHNPISATRDVEDTIATEELRQAARESVSNIYRFDEHITEGVIIEVEQIFDQIESARQQLQDKFEAYKQELQKKKEIQKKQEEQLTEEQDNQSTEQREDQTTEQEDTQPIEQEIEENEPSPDEILTDQFIGEIKENFPIMLSKDEIITCLNADEEELILLKDQLLKTLNKLLELHIKQDNLLEARNTLRDEIMSLPVSNEIRILGTTIGVSVLKPNMVFDKQATEEEKDRAAQSVEPVIYKKGQYIVQAGQPITIQQYKMLQDLGLLKEDMIDFTILVGVGVIVLLVEVIVILYLAAFEKRILENPSHLLMISLIVWMVLGLALAVSQLHQYLIPIALGAMLLTVLIGPTTAGIINIALSILIGIMLDNHLNIMVMGISGGILGIYLCNRAEQRNALVWAGLVVSCVNYMSIFSLEMMTSGGWLSSLKVSTWGIGSGLLAGVFLIGTLPIWENLFGIVTPIKLMELSNPNHPVLKRLLMEAPGTYHHSIIVANLAENAAEAVGADGLLARVGAYYHDIGKLKRPLYFRENQIATGNPHDKLNPTLSTHIILSHAKDGVELAKKYRVPKVIQDFILQHHGTTAVAYFYHKAKEMNNGDKIHIDDFRYVGPKPKKKETAIVMLADTVEAAVRSIPDPTPGKVERLIRKLIKSKMEDGQLDDCHLTLKDLNTIANAFSGVMTGVFHERIEYPNTEENGRSQEGENKNED
ncbi:MAG: HDIG domain-containing metalloprotein [Caldicoprobacterales bacterium]|nr:HDIG domain-containing protein [Clostridiales bacterium]